MSDVVIRAENLGKKYVIGHQAPQERYVALRDVISRTAGGLIRSAKDMLGGRQLVAGDELEEFWALKDVSFEIKRGEVVGVIGRNGAGKSTLLKVLSRITEPSTGRVQIKGRVASLLEVGTGFHHELTGRENIYLNGAILGMTRAEIKRKFDEIVAFAEVEKFLDTPVKRYSSGMYVRLAFAVAAHLEPEILIVDEVLAVGDAEFQKKCLGKMGEVASHGRTVLFVSHNMRAVKSLCQTAILLQHGTIKLSGAAPAVCDAYFNRLDITVGDDALERDLAKSPYAHFHSIRAHDYAGVTCSSFSASEAIQITIDYTPTDPTVCPVLNVHIFNDQNIQAFASINTITPRPNTRMNVTVTIPPNQLNEGEYSASVFASTFNPDIIHTRLDHIVSFDVSDVATNPIRSGFRGKFPGVVRPLLNWKLNEAPLE